MHQEADQQYAVCHNFCPYQVDLDMGMGGTTRMTGGTQTIGITTDLR